MNPWPQNYFRNQSTFNHTLYIIPRDSERYRVLSLESLWILSPTSQALSPVIARDTEHLTLDIINKLKRLILALY